MLLADGGEAIADLAVMRNQSDLFGPVASGPTAWRVLSSGGAYEAGGDVQESILRIAQTWPWAGELATAYARLAALPQPVR